MKKTIMKKIFLTIILSSVFVFGIFGYQLVASAEVIDSILNALPTPTPPPNPSPGATAENCKLVNGQQVCSLENPLQGNKTDATAIISTVITGALGIIGALTLLMLVWGGFQWLTSAGNPEKVKMGTQTMVWAVIGVVLVFASYVLLSTFTGYLTGRT